MRPTRTRQAHADGPAAREVHLVELTVMPPEIRYNAVLGYLHAAVLADPALAARCEVRKHVLHQGQGEPDLETATAALLDSLDHPLVLALTICFWNRPASLDLARRAKERWPDCRIVIGGNDVTNQQDAVFAEAPWVDVLVHGEGELRFAELVRAFLDHPGGGPGLDAALDAIRGTSRRDPATGRITTTRPADRIADLSEVPSPLLTEGVWSDEDLARSHTIVYETNRGCPYSCAFCYWGGATNSKVRRFEMDRISAELDRIVRCVRPGAQLFIADANFGLLPRDVEIARLLVELCARHGKRIVMLTNWAKNTSGRVLEIAELLHGAGLAGAITLSAQSFDAEVLDIANRRNIRVDHYRRLQAEFRGRGIPTYTDLIWGLPGETPDTHRDGIEEAIATGGSPVVYPLLLLNNTDYTHDRFRDEHGLTARRLPCDPGYLDLLADVVTEHSRMTFEQWLAGMEFRLPLTLYHKCLLRGTLRVLAAETGARTVDLLDVLGAHLRSGAGDPVLPFLVANYTASWRTPEAFAGDFLDRQLRGTGVIHEELHYQALLRRTVGTLGAARAHARGAVDALYTALAAEGRTLPPRAGLDAVTALDTAATAVFRAGLTRRLERHEVRLPRRYAALLQEFGDLPPGTVPDGPAGGGATLVVDVPPARAHYTFSPYALSVWHGSGRPLVDAGTRPADRRAAEPAGAPA